jgi:hypothetical protein
MTRLAHVIERFSGDLIARYTSAAIPLGLNEGLTSPIPH